MSEKDEQRDPLSMRIGKRYAAAEELARKRNDKFRILLWMICYAPIIFIFWRLGLSPFVLALISPILYYVAMVKLSDTYVAALKVRLLRLVGRDTAE